ncbi:hypothetical protein C2W27_14445 [Salmonella enterica]|nr:hypothetical protein [Salmonella enterica]
MSSRKSPKTATRRAEKSAELVLLEDMNARLVRIEGNLDDVKHVASKSGAIAGGIAGGIVATSIMFVKALAGLS